MAYSLQKQEKVSENEKMANILPHNPAGGGAVCQVGVETVETKDYFSAKEQKEKSTLENDASPAHGVKSCRAH